MTDLNLKWVGKNNKIEKLKKIGVKDLETKLSEVKTIQDELEVLKKDSSDEITKRIADLEVEKISLEAQIKELEEPGAKKTFDWFRTDKGGGFNYFKKLEKWAEDLSKKKLDNRYEVNWGDETIYTIESLGAERIAYEIAFQLAKIDDADLNAKMTAAGYEEARKKKITDPLAKIRTYVANMKQEGIRVIIDANGKKRSPMKTEENALRAGEKEIFYHEYEEGQNNFVFDDLYDLVKELADSTEIDDDKHIINKLENKWGDEKVWYIWRAKNTPMSKEELEKRVGNGAPKYYLDKDCNKLYDDDTNNGKKIELAKGLRGWIDLYYSIFTKKTQRDKLKLGVEGDGSVQKNVNNEIIFEALRKTNNNISIESSELTNNDGSNQMIHLFGNVKKIKAEKEAQLKRVKAQMIAEEALLSEASKNKNTENLKEIEKKEKELEKKDKEISQLVKNEVPGKQKKVNDLGVADANFKFDNDKNIIKALATKQLLSTIKWLENDGNESGEFKLVSNKTLFDKISAQDDSTWSAAVKRYFEGKGSDLQARITKVEEEESTEGIGLEVIRDAYEEIGAETEVIEGINEKLKPEPTSGITKESLTKLFGFSVDEALKTNWTKSDEKTLTEQDIKDIVIKDYFPGKTKYDGLISHLKDQGDDKGNKNDYDTGDDAKKKESWEKFIKKGAETVIRTIAAHERDDDLKKPIDKGNPIIKEMMSDTYKSTSGYDDDPTKCKFNKERYGNPKDLGSEAPDKTKIINWLHDVKLKNIKQQDTFWKTTTGDNGKDGNGKNESWFWPWHGGWKNWVAWGVTATLVIGVACVAIFWKDISEWWNGPAEGEDKTDENEEENE